MNRTTWTLVCVAVAAIIVEIFIIVLTGNPQGNVSTPTGIHGVDR